MFITIPPGNAAVLIMLVPYLNLAAILESNLEISGGMSRTDFYPELSTTIHYG